jgi:hypothetical protein
VCGAGVEIDVLAHHRSQRCSLKTYLPRKLWPRRLWPSRFGPRYVPFPLVGCATAFKCLTLTHTHTTHTHTTTAVGQGHEVIRGDVRLPPAEEQDLQQAPRRRGRVGVEPDHASRRAYPLPTPRSYRRVGQEVPHSAYHGDTCAHTLTTRHDTSTAFWRPQRRSA